MPLLKPAHAGTAFRRLTAGRHAIGNAAVLAAGPSTHKRGGAPIGNMIQRKYLTARVSSLTPMFQSRVLGARIYTEGPPFMKRSIPDRSQPRAAC